MEKNCHFKTWKSVTNGASRKLDNSFAEGLGFVVNEENRIYNVSANTTVSKSMFLFYSVEVHMGKINLCVECLHNVDKINNVTVG